MGDPGSDGSCSERRLAGSAAQGSCSELSIAGKQLSALGLAQVGPCAPIPANSYNRPVCFYVGLNHTHSAATHMCEDCETLMCTACIHYHRYRTVCPGKPQQYHREYREGKDCAAAHARPMPLFGKTLQTPQQRPTNLRHSGANIARVGSRPSATKHQQGSHVLPRAPGIGEFWMRNQSATYKAEIKR